MSLQVWLPLNGDIKNQGLDNTKNPTLMGTGITWTVGKIGQAATFPNNCNSCIYLPRLRLQTGSFAAWIKVNGAGASARQCIISEGRDSYNDGVEFYTSQAGTSLSFKAHEKIISTTIALNQWYHVAGTFGNGEVKLYLNGELKGTQTYTADMTYQYALDLVLGKMSYSYTNTSNYFSFNGQLNDVRIYNHVLSDKEIKEIAKGLILHYKLDNNGLGNPNLFKGTIMRPIDRTSFVSNSSKDWTKYLRYYNGNTSIHTFAEEDGIYIDTVKLNSAANLGICFGRLASEINLDSSSYYTISCEAKCTKAGAGLDIGLSYLTTSDSWVWRGGSNRKLFNNTTDWQFFTHTFKPDSDTKAIDYCFTVLGVSNGTDTLSIRKCKLEKGSVATSWFPAPEDMGINENIIYDSSGYNHNGTFSNNSTIKIISDPPKYSYGIHLSKTKINCTTGFPAGDNPDFTVVFWARIFSNITYVSYGDLTGMYDTGQGSNTFRLELCGSPASNNIMWFRGPSGQSSGGFNMNTSSNNGWFSKDTWHQIALTGNGQTKQYICYLDGVQCGTYNGSANSWSPTGQFYIGDTIEATADFSDYRIYSTVLSPEAIKELYNTSATIDNLGNTYARELVEI